MTIKHILNKINIHISTYIIILLSFLAGYFEIVFLTVLSIVIHELGHFLTASFLNLRVKEVRVFMFGGVTVLDERLNIDIRKEIITLVMGPITQVFFVLLVYMLFKMGYVNYRTWYLLFHINLLLLSFNLLPILPLDGGKLVNNILDYVFSYRISHILSIVISMISIPLVLFYNNKLVVIFIIIFLIVKNMEEISIHRYKIVKFITERKIYCKHKKCKNIKNIKDIYRNKNFKIKVNDMWIDEKEYFKMFRL